MSLSTKTLTLLLLILLCVQPEAQCQADGKQLNGAAKYELKQLNRPLGTAEKQAEAGQLRQAKQGLADVEEAFQRICKGYSLDSSYAKVAKLEGRIAALGTKVGGLAGKDQQDRDALGPLLGALETANQQLEVSFKEADRALRNLSSMRRDYQREGNAAKFNQQLLNAGLLAEKVQAILPGALAAAAEFRRQYPDPFKLGQRIPAAKNAHVTLAQLESRAKDWDTYRKSYIEEFVTEAVDLVERYEERLASPPDDATRKQMLAEDALSEVVDYSSRLIEAVIAFYPGEENEMVRHAKALTARIEKVAGAASELLGQADAAEKARLGQARFPATEYQGGEWTEVEKIMERAFKTFAPDKQPIKIAVSSPWDERTEARWRERWIVGTYKYVGGYVAAEMPSGDLRVYSLSFRKQLQDDGSFGPFGVFAVGHSYEMLKENL